MRQKGFAASDAVLSHVKLTVLVSLLKHQHTLWQELESLCHGVWVESIRNISFREIFNVLFL